MTDRIREDVAYALEEVGDELINEAAHVEAREEERQDVSLAELNEALAKHVKGAYYRRAAELLRKDKKGVTL